MASLAERIAAAFPDVGRVEPLRELGHGARSEVFATAEGIAVKIGRVPVSPCPRGPRRFQHRARE